MQESYAQPRPYRYPSEYEANMIRDQHPDLICPACDASGVKGCESCGGRGLVCPTCRGGRFVKRKGAESRDYEYQVSICPECSDMGKYSLSRELALVSVYRKRAFNDSYQQKQLGDEHEKRNSSEYGGHDQ